jgi:hypothetical protein
VPVARAPNFESGIVRISPGMDLSMSHRSLKSIVPREPQCNEVFIAVLPPKAIALSLRAGEEPHSALVPLAEIA